MQCGQGNWAMLCFVAQITESMRSEVVDWMTRMIQRLRMTLNTLFVAVNIMDRFLSLEKAFPAKRLERLGVTALFIAAKQVRQCTV